MFRLLLVITLVMLPAYAYSASVETFNVYSQAMKKDVPNTIILPKSYNAEGAALPVLYALHGATDDHSFWPTIVPKIQELADQYGIIVVCPDGAKTSWYIDSPLDPSFQYETYISRELVNYVDNTFNTQTDKASRAIMGLSMGGFGAFYLAIRNSNVYSAAISTSGAFDLRPFPNNWDIAKRIGKQTEYPANWENYSVVNMAGLLKGKSLALFFDIGVDDFFYNGNKEFHQSLLSMQIPHSYLEMPGGHTLEYWQNSINYHFVFLDEHFKTN
ncbi:alpha/beta hydrolase family protein [uncultured Paraglaciecola sp.]|uniref:alpha/beta hydrolase n=1 Tax=uncultured Paraglaciecola sp. TaxID=1765024 RepID=UPI0030D9BA5B